MRPITDTDTDTLIGEPADNSEYKADGSVEEIGETVITAAFDHKFSVKVSWFDEKGPRWGRGKWYALQVVP